MKAKLIIVVLALTLLVFVGQASPVATAGVQASGTHHGPTVAKLPSTIEMYAWVWRLWLTGALSEYGYRMPGTDADHNAANYILDKFEDFGLQDTSLEPVSAPLSLPDRWSLTLQMGTTGERIPSSFARYAGFTPPEGITAEMVYVGQGTPADFAAKSVAGKIVVVDVIAPPTPMSAFDPISLFVYDPDNTMPGDNAIENWPVRNLPSSYDLAKTNGAAGYVGILTFTVNNNSQYLHWYASGGLPALFVSPNDGDYLRNLLASGPVSANMVLTGTNETGVVYNIYGFLPGNTDEIIVVESHYDGWATNEASGAAVVMALAKYYAQVPQESRERTLMFVLWGSHFGEKAPWTSSLAYTLLPKIVAVNSIEMIGKQYKIIDGKYVSTGLIAPVGLAITKATKPNPYLLSFSRDAILAHDLDRTRVIFGYYTGEMLKWVAAGVPTIGRISHNAPQFTSADTPFTVQVDALRPTAAAFVDIIDDIDVTAANLLK